MIQEEIIKFNKFRKLCLINAEDAIRTAEELRNKSVNHIAFQLAVFCLEEIGKVFVGWYQFNSKERWGEDTYVIPIDDHIKKLFWAIWGPSFTNEKFSSEQMDELKNMATNLHNRRLDVMYTELSDMIPSSKKISNDELDIYLKMARARLDIAKLEGEVETNISEEKQEDISWFMKISNHPEKRKFIFDHKSQDKLIEFGNVNEWIVWLKEYFLDEERELTELLKKEIENPIKDQIKKTDPKWKITIKVISKSHSIRQNILDKFSSKSNAIKLKKGADNHTLLIDIFLDKSIAISELWHQGWNTSNLLVNALNVGTNGLFYWNIPKNVDKFYESILDLENKKRLDAKLHTSLELDWSSHQLYFTELEVGTTFLVFRYFSEVFDSPEYEPIEHYMVALGMLAKNDIHLHLEEQSFLNFYLAFKKAIIINERCEESVNIKEIGFKLIGGLLSNREEYDKVIEIGQSLETNNVQPELIKFSLTEIIAMKQYAGLYFITLAARKMYGDKAVLLTKNRNNSKGKN